MAMIPICVKTPKGIEAVEKRTHGLPMRARQVLIMIDGKRDYDTLLTMFPGDVLPAAYQQLLDDGFIVALGRPAAVTTRQSPTPANDEERLAMARNFMMNTLDAFVGLAASSLISRIEACPSIEALRHLFNDWHDAVALSGDGRKRLGELAAKLAALLS